MCTQVTGATCCPALKESIAGEKQEAISAQVLAHSKGPKHGYYLSIIIKRQKEKKEGWF